MDQADTKLHQTALARYKLAAQAEQAQRARELEDLAFAAGDQWEPDVLAQRKAQPGVTGGVPPTPARPCFTINKLKQPLQQVGNQQRQARLALEFAPKTSDAARETADAFEDIARAIQTDSRAHLARSWAMKRTAECGRGAYRITTEYANDGDFDLDIVYKRILNQFAVVLDPFAQEPDWSDGEWAFITEDVKWDRYQRQYPDSTLIADEDALTALGTDAPDWVSGDGDDRIVRVAEYWRVEHETHTLQAWTLPDGTEQNYRDDEPPPDGAVPATGRDGHPVTRTLQVPVVKWCKINGAEVLDREDWPGRYIPIIPTIGTEFNINGERRWEGLVRASRDAQRLFNYEASAMAEVVALSTRAPYIGYMETIEPYLEWWAQLNTRSFPMLPVAYVRDASGAPLPPPKREVAEPAIQAISLTLHEADGYIKATTGIFDASLGNLNPSDRSGKAILALQKQSEAGTSEFLDNLANMSMVLEGKILKDLIPKVYDRPGRVVAAIGADDQRRQIMVNAPSVMKGGKPQQVPHETPGSTFIDLTAGEYSVAATVGKSHTTRREEAVSQMGELAQAVPDLVPKFADIWVDNMDGPGFKQIADRLKKQLPPELQDNGGDGPNPAVLQQQVQQASQMIQILTAELHAKNDLIEKDTLKIEADLAKTHADNATKVEIASINAQASLAVAEMKNQLDAAKQTVAQLESMMGLAHERALQSEQLSAAQQQQGQQQAHDQAMQAGQQDHEAGLAAGQQGHEQQMAAQEPAPAGA